MRDDSIRLRPLGTSSLPAQEKTGRVSFSDCYGVTVVTPDLNVQITYPHRWEHVSVMQASGWRCLKCFEVRGGAEEDLPTHGCTGNQR